LELEDKELFCDWEEHVKRCFPFDPEDVSFSIGDETKPQNYSSKYNSLDYNTLENDGVKVQFAVQACCQVDQLG